MGLIAFLCSDLPAWKQLTSSTLETHKRIPLVRTVFSDSEEVEIVGHLCGDDAQTFVDVIDEVSLTLPPPRSRPFPPCLNSCAVSARYWIAYHHEFKGGACAPCIGSVAAKPWFRGHSKSHSVMTQGSTRFVMVGLRMCGGDNIMAGM